MASKFVESGDTLNYTAGGVVASGSVVELKHCLGVAQGSAAASGDVIPVAIEGVYTMPKVSGAVWVAGEKLVWDTSAGAFDDALATPDSGDIVGAAVAMAAGLNGETTASVKLTPGTGAGAGSAVYAFGSLPASPVQGDRAIVTDSNTATFNATAAAGGANIVPVFYNGTVWKVG